MSLCKNNNSGGKWKVCKPSCFAISHRTFNWTVMWMQNIDSWIYAAVRRVCYLMLWEWNRNIRHKLSFKYIIIYKLHLLTLCKYWKRPVCIHPWRSMCYLMCVTPLEHELFCFFSFVISGPSDQKTLNVSVWRLIKKNKHIICWIWRTCTFCVLILKGVEK